MTNQSPNPFAKNDDEAKQRFKRFQSQDPFPDIAPALLNSADIYDYVAVTAMIHPFDVNKLKSASYAVPILGKVVYWDERNQKQVENIDRNQEFILRPNSIAFVTIEPVLRLPDYIAFRFNLKITNVYRGILLGTGPLVDPGFVGKLSIPLHNLTTNDYKFVGGEDLIWMEFTKLSPNQRWNTINTSSNSIPRIGQYVEFPSDKALPDVEGYLRKADQHRSIRSSIPEVFHNAEEAAKEASNTVKYFQRVGILSALAIFIALGALFFQTYSLVQDSVSYVKNSRDEKVQYEKTIQTLEKEIKVLKEQVKELNKLNELPSKTNNKKK
jgi:deoxycytidine triphosphate deaminase/cell division protein FtsB